MTPRRAHEPEMPTGHDDRVLPISTCGDLTSLILVPRRMIVRPSMARSSSCWRRCRRRLDHHDTDLRISCDRRRRRRSESVAAMTAPAARPPAPRRTLDSTTRGCSTEASPLHAGPHRQRMNSDPRPMIAPRRSPHGTIERWVTRASPPRSRRIDAVTGARRMKQCSSAIMPAVGARAQERPRQADTLSAREARRGATSRRRAVPGVDQERDLLRPAESSDATP